MTIRLENPPHGRSTSLSPLDYPFDADSASRVDDMFVLPQTLRASLYPSWNQFVLRFLAKGGVCVIHHETFYNKMKSEVYSLPISASGFLFQQSPYLYPSGSSLACVNESARLNTTVCI